MRARRFAVVAAVAAVLLTGPLAGVAAAHVAVSADGASQGGYATITFRVPTERDVPTTKVEIAMPQDTPIASVRVEPVPGWDASLVTAPPAVPMTDDDGVAVDDVVSRVVWTATGAGILPDQFERFTISAGPLPATDTITFKALQTYADGQVVSWIDQAAEGAAEPEYPAPVLALSPATGDDHHAAGATATTGQAAAETHGDSSGLAIAALAVSVVALLGVGYLLLTRRRAPTPGGPAAAAQEPVSTGAGG